MVFRNLSGADLYHIIALLSHETRKEILESGILDQEKVLTMSEEPKLMRDIVYAHKLADVIHLRAYDNNHKSINKMADMIHGLNACYQDAT